MSDDLESELRHLFDTARGAMEPTSDDRSRIRAGLSAKLASGVLLTSATANAAAAGGAATGTVLGKGMKLVLLGQIGPGIIAGTLLGAGASFLASAASDAFTPQPSDATVSSAPAPAQLPAKPAVPPDVTSVSPRSAPTRNFAPVPAPRSSARAVADVEAPPNPAPNSGASAIAAFPEARPRAETPELNDELTIVSRIHEAWQRGDAAGVRRAVAAHEQRFPRGTLTEEREAVKVMLACRNAEPARRAGLGSAFLGRYPGSTHAGRVIAICGAKP